MGYKKGYNQQKGVTNLTFETDELNSAIEIAFLKTFVFKFEYENIKNSSKSKSAFFEIGNTSISYQKKNNPLQFEVFANNLFNTKSKNNNSFSDYMNSEQTTFILPRAFMLSICYKL